MPNMPTQPMVVQIQESMDMTYHIANTPTEPRMDTYAHTRAREHTHKHTPTYSTII